MEFSDAKKLKKQKELLVWNIQSKPSKTEEEQEKFKMDIEKLSPCTLIKSCKELNDARDAIKTTLSKNQRVSQKRVIDELKSRHERNNRVYETLTDEQLEFDTLKKAFQYIKKTVFSPQNICSLVDQHIKTLNMSAIEAFRQLGK